jgi:hypothetical protein
VFLPRCKGIETRLSCGAIISELFAVELTTAKLVANKSAVQIVLA